MLNWKKGDRITIRAHASEPGDGLRYHAQTVTASEDGFTGGWDVFDSIADNGKELSFYGHSVVAIARS